MGGAEEEGGVLVGKTPLGPKALEKGGGQEERNSSVFCGQGQAAFVRAMLLLKCLGLGCDFLKRPVLNARKRWAGVKFPKDGCKGLLPPGTTHAEDTVVTSH